MSDSSARPDAAGSNDTCTTSPGVLLAPFGDGAVAWDPITETAHVLNPTAAWLLLAAEEGPTPIAALAAGAGAGADGTDVTDSLVAGVDGLRRLGLLDRDELPAVPEPRRGSTRTVPRSWATGAVHAVLDHGVALRGPDAALIAELDRFLGSAVDAREPTLWFDVEPTDDGGVVVTTDDEWAFPSRSGLLAQLPGVVNEHAARSHDMAVVHAGAVRTPAGRVIMLPGTIDAGKSTVTAALVRAGCDYLGDESIGIRPGTLDLVAHPKPLTLDATSRAALDLPAPGDPHLAVEALRADVVRLAGDVGPVDLVLLPEYQGPRPVDPAGSDEPDSTTRLDPADALRALLGSTLNLARAGAQGLADLCRVAEEVPFVRVRHRGSRDLAARLVDGDLSDGAVPAPPATSG